MRGIGLKTANALLRQHRSLEACLPAALARSGDALCVLSLAPVSLEHEFFLLTLANLALNIVHSRCMLQAPHPRLAPSLACVVMPLDSAHPVRRALRSAPR